MKVKKKKKTHAGFNTHGKQTRFGSRITVIPCSEISDNTFQHVENIFNKSLCKQS